MTKPLTKLWKCPTCGVEFKAGETRQDKKAGRTCPDGHFHSYYELKRHEDGKPLGVRKPAPLPAKRFDYAHKFVSRDDKAEMLALLWVAAVDRLVEQMPAGSVARRMVEGATQQAYRVSQGILDHGREAAA